MSEDLTEGPFDDAEKHLDEAHSQAVEDVKAKVQTAKAAAVKKVS